VSDLATPVALPTPPTDGGRPDRAGTRAWVAEHLGDLAAHGAPTAPSPVAAGGGLGGGAVSGGQQAADAALAAFDPTGYAERRNEVWPPGRRGASGLSPWVRHGLLTLADLWTHVADAPGADRQRFRDELLWQEYARHLYARLGTATATSLRFTPADLPDASAPAGFALEGEGAVLPSGDLACIALALGELAAAGWVPNQARLWLASWWVGHGGRRWEDGEDWLFARLLDGSRAANRLGWQWVAGTATGSAWVLERSHVERRAPGLCATCLRRLDCPLERTAGGPSPGQSLGALPDADPRLAAQPGGEPGGVAVTGPEVVRSAPGRSAPEAVWLTAESLGDADPALAAHPDLPALFVFDAPLLARLRLSADRLVFLAETLADLSTRREVAVWRGDPVAALSGRPLAVTFAPVPGFARRSAALQPVETHPWPWLTWPDGAPLRSFSAWRRALDVSSIGAGTRR
jgi:deoxyribodipyrimidine photo-lyase